MSDDRIFQEIKGVFSWIEKTKEKSKNEQQQQFQSNEDKTYYQIREFLNFLNVDASHEEVEALNELANPDGKDCITYENFIKIFVKTDKELEQEKLEMQQAFQKLTLDKSKKQIPVERLDKVLNMYDQKYKNSIPNILSEIEQSSHCVDGKFKFDDYLNEYYDAKMSKKDEKDDQQQENRQRSQTGQ